MGLTFKYRGTPRKPTYPIRVSGLPYKVAINDGQFTQLLLSASASKNPTHLLPYGVCWMHGSGQTFSIALPPQERWIVYTNMNRGDMTPTSKKVNFKIFVPWTLVTVRVYETYTYNVADLHCHILSGPPTSLDQRVWPIPLPNFYNTGKMCAAATIPPSESPSVAAAASAALTALWDGGMNWDMGTMHNSILARSKRNRSPSAIFAKMGEIYARPTGDPYQFLRAWSRLKPEEILAIDDWSDPSSWRDVINTHFDHQAAGQTNLQLALTKHLGRYAR